MADCVAGQAPFSVGYGPVFPAASSSPADLMIAIQNWFDDQYAGSIVDSIQYVDLVSGGLNVGTITVEPGYPGYAWEIFATEVCTVPVDPPVDPVGVSPDSFMLIALVVVAMFFAGIAGFRQGASA